MARKILEETLLPSNLSEMAARIVELFDSNAPQANVPSDDLIQFDFGFAGRDDETPTFTITFFPEPEPTGELFEPQWFLSLNIEELRLIASGKRKKLKLWRCVSDCGMRANQSDFYCAKCDA
jgi:hypothetical protein